MYILPNSPDYGVYTPQQSGLRYIHSSSVRTTVYIVLYSPDYDVYSPLQSGLQCIYSSTVRTTMYILPNSPDYDVYSPLQYIHHNLYTYLNRKNSKIITRSIFNSTSNTKTCSKLPICTVLDKSKKNSLTRLSFSSCPLCFHSVSCVHSLGLKLDSNYINN